MNNKFFTLICFWMLLLCSCKNANSQKPQTLETNEPSFNSINLDSLIKDANNPYLLTIEDGVLSMVGYTFSDLHLFPNKSMFKVEKERYDDNYLNIYRYKNSYVKFIVEDRDTIIVCGRLANNDVLSSKSSILLGKSKNEFLSLFFEPSEQYQKIKSFIIYNDESGENWIEFVFSEDRLQWILFDSVYEDVKRE